MFRRICKLAVLFVLGAPLALSHPALAEERGGKKPVLVGGTLSLTGKYEEMGKMQEKGYRLWEAEVNRRGGLLGRPVKLLITDDQSNPKKVVEVYTDLLKRKAVDLAISPYSSELTLAAADLFEKFRYPVVASGASSEQIWETPRRYTVGLLSTADRYLIGFLELCAIYKKDKVSITGFQDTFSLYSAKGAKKWAGTFGLKVVHYNILAGSDEKEFALEADRIAAVKPDVVVVAGHFNNTVGVRKALEGTTAKNVVFAGTVGPAMKQFQAVLGPLAEGAFGASQWEPDDRILYPGSSAFIGFFRKTYGTEPSYHAAAAYAAVRLIEEAIINKRSLNRENIRKFIITGEHKTIVGPFKLRYDGTQIGHKSMIIQWQKGKKEIVWPEDLRTAIPVFTK